MAFARLGDGEKAWELLRMISPVGHGDSPAAIARYKVEPYVVAADVYAVAPHVGRGGWTWYTGSSGWMYRLIVESLLGLHREGASLRLAPVLPAEWPGVVLRYRYGDTVYRIDVRHAAPGAGSSLVVDGVGMPGNVVALVDDGRAHAVELAVARPSAPGALVRDPERPGATA
jgi:cellobiose phosphorylase